jgi:UDP-glucose 4-epimerase
LSTIAVTGAAGFIGSNLVDRLLAGGVRVLGVDDLSTGTPANLSDAERVGAGGGFAFVPMDVRERDLERCFAEHQPEVVMHLAAQASVAVSMREPSLDASINVLGLLNVLDAASRTGARKVVFASSGGTTYGEADDLPLREPERIGARPSSAYGISKKVAEDYLALYRASRGLDYTILALGNVYGRRQDPNGEAGVISIFGSKMLAGERPVIFGDGEQTRDYVFVDDAVAAFVLAADPGRGSGMFLNVGTGVETSVNEILRLLAEATGYAGEPEHVAARTGELRRNAIDPSAAADHLGWRPTTDLAEGIAATAEWIRRSRS